MTEQQRLFGTDLRLERTREPFDLRPNRAGDLELARGDENIAQALTMRLRVRRGELAPLGWPAYGSRLHELVSEPNVNRTLGLVSGTVTGVVLHLISLDSSVGASMYRAIWAWVVCVVVTVAVSLVTHPQARLGAARHRVGPHRAEGGQGGGLVQEAVDPRGHRPHHDPGPEHLLLVGGAHDRTP